MTVELTEAELANRNTKLNRQRLAIQESAGAWRDEDNPELADGSAAWFRPERIARYRQAD